MKKSKWIGCIVVAAVVIMTVTVVKLWQKKPHKDSVSNYDMGTMSHTTQKEENEIYNHTENAGNRRETEEALQSLVTDQNEETYAKTARGIFDVLHSGSESEIEKRLCTQAVKEKGYAFNSGVAKNLKKHYGQPNVIQAVKYIPFRGYCYCMAKIGVIKTAENGECTMDYATADDATFTIYKDGTFLPFALERIAEAGNGVHKIRTVEPTANPELVKDAPLIPGIDDVDAPE